jgi:hypothetical protein
MFTNYGSFSANGKTSPLSDEAKRRFTEKIREKIAR